MCCYSIVCIAETIVTLISFFITSIKVKNLRSSVARGAIACLGDLFATMQRAMEQVNRISHAP